MLYQKKIRNLLKKINKVIKKEEREEIINGVIINGVIIN